MNKELLWKIKIELQNLTNDFDEMSNSLNYKQDTTWDTYDSGNWAAMSDNLYKLLDEIDNELSTKV